MPKTIIIICLSLLYSCSPRKSIVISQASYKNVEFTLTKLAVAPFSPDTLARFIPDSIYFVEEIDITLSNIKRKDKICLSIENNSTRIIFLGKDLENRDKIDIKWDHIKNRLAFINHKRISRKTFREHKNWR